MESVGLDLCTEKTTLHQNRRELTQRHNIERLMKRLIQLPNTNVEKERSLCCYR